MISIFIFVGYCLGLNSRITSLKKEEVNEKRAEESSEDCLVDEEFKMLPMTPFVSASNGNSVEEKETKEGEDKRRKSVPQLVQKYEEISKVEDDPAQPSIKRRQPEGSLTGRNKFKLSARS